jgi:hypothetical protein
MKTLIEGAIAGALATIPMTIVMESLHERIPGEPARPLPPREITENAALKAHARDELTERDMQNLTLAGHFGYGALCGAVFGLIAPKHPAAACAAGVAFGVGVWAGSYAGWLPAARLHHHARFDPAARNGLMISAHAVWGAAAGLVLARRSG